MTRKKNISPGYFKKQGYYNYTIRLLQKMLNYETNSYISIIGLSTSKDPWDFINIPR